MTTAVHGLGAMMQAHKEATTREEGSSSINSFGIKAGENKVIRFVTDDVIGLYIHSYVDCRDGKKRTFICPNQSDGELHDNGECLICKYYTKVSAKGNTIPMKPSMRGIGLVVERYSDAPGQPLKDVVYDTPQKIMVDGKEEEVTGLPIVYLLNMPIKGFWSHATAAASRYGTLMDRDYALSRQGEKLDTTYSIMPLDKSDSPDLDTKEKTEAAYAIPKLASITLDEYVKRYSNIEYQRRFCTNIPVSEQINDNENDVEPEQPAQQATQNFFKPADVSQPAPQAQPVQAQPEEAVAPQTVQQPTAAAEAPAPAPAEPSTFTAGSFESLKNRLTTGE